MESPHAEESSKKELPPFCCIEPEGWRHHHCGSQRKHHPWENAVGRGGGDGEPQALVQDGCGMKDRRGNPGSGRMGERMPTLHALTALAES